MNRVILLGRMARDPEVRYTQAAEPLAVCRFSVAVDRPFSRNRQEGEPTADFINCVCFGKRGESIGQYFRKGNRIAVTGRLQVSNYTDQQGNKRYSTDVIVEDFEFVESKAERANSGEGGFAPAPSVQPSAPASAAGFSIDSDAEDEDLPF
ncbi:MAG: single-stranded DNA-binding protein [Clostridia bacterium]|nr:single-stranded DNA-binding protein [Clostridia bacterium]